jgi:hypothetical protein
MLLGKPLDGTEKRRSKGTVSRCSAWVAPIRARQPVGRHKGQKLVILGGVDHSRKMRFHLEQRLTSSDNPRTQHTCCNWMTMTAR